MKKLFIFLICILSVNLSLNSSELQKKQSFFEFMENHSVHCNKCALQKILVKIISNLSEKIGKKDVYEAKIVQTLIKYNKAIEQLGSDKLNLEPVYNIEIISIIDLTNELSKNNDIDFGEILIREILDVIKEYSKDLNYLEKVIKSTVIRLSEESSMRYEYAMILNKKDFVRSFDQLFNLLILTSKKMAQLQNKEYGLIIFENLLFQMNKHVDNSQHNKHCAIQ